MTREEKEYLDKLSNDELVAFLSCGYGFYEDKWEEVSEQEYFEHLGTKEPTLTDIVIKELTDERIYRRVPIYNNEHAGILYQISHKPDGYKYEKLVGKSFVIALGSEMFNYVKERGVKL